MTKIDFSKINIKLFEGNVNLNEFTCGDGDLDEFLKETALEQKRELFNATYLFYYETEIIGFLTINMDSIKIKSLSGRIQRISGYKTVPAVKLGRLGVNQKFKNKKVGTFMIKWLQNNIITISNEIGSRVIITDAYPPVVKFYRKNLFKIAPHEKNKLEKKINKYQKAKIRKKESKERVIMFFDLKETDN